MSVTIRKDGVQIAASQSVCGWTADYPAEKWNFVRIDADPSSRYSIQLWDNTGWSSADHLFLTITAKPADFAGVIREKLPAIDELARAVEVEFEPVTGAASRVRAEPAK